MFTQNYTRVHIDIGYLQSYIRTVISPTELLSPDYHKIADWIYSQGFRFNEVCIYIAKEQDTNPQQEEKKGGVEAILGFFNKDRPSISMSDSSNPVYYRWKVFLGSLAKKPYNCPFCRSKVALYCGSCGHDFNYQVVQKGVDVLLASQLMGDAADIGSYSELSVKIKSLGQDSEKILEMMNPLLKSIRSEHGIHQHSPRIENSLVISADTDFIPMIKGHTLPSGKTFTLMVGNDPDGKSERGRYVPPIGYVNLLHDHPDQFNMIYMTPEIVRSWMRPYQPKNRTRRVG